MLEFLPFLLQGLLMGADELYCHRRRELRRWERIGHPLDTLFYLSGLVWLLLNSPTPQARLIYAAIAVLSCLFVSKDEWEHRELCTGFENWLHSLLFMLHPVLLIWAGWLWWQQNPVFKPVVEAAAVLSLMFMIYQAVFWNLLRHD